ncbi:TasA family protein [Fervidibacillus halotolerans]|uniref:CalY family protein n=1 Tax=Fervidibacillus halotolerans TaxID=2980027 RepID=A0A9E8RY41_9BACI|nr:TasA family protein [Fervidibacillus halotolerans]WAA11834.1 CalY family protein [Fervidibacillus halotolerans]
MGFKRKLTTGALSAILGISLITGGTWAAFNDIENADASVEAGTLNLDLKKVGKQPYTIEVSNLKPGDSIERKIKFVNSGTLAIKEVLMAIEDVQFTDYTPRDDDDPGANDLDTWNENDVLEFLDQFKVSVILVGAEGGTNYPVNIIPESAEVTLKDFYLASGTVYGDSSKPASQEEIDEARMKLWNTVDRRYIDAESNRINGASVQNVKYAGIPLDPSDVDILEVKIEFMDNDERNPDGSFVQNKFQGDRADITISFEATQWDGQEITDEDLRDDGYIESNEKAHNGDY